MKQKKSATICVVAWICVSMVFMNGCTHQLAIKNIESYQTFGIMSLEKPLKIGITSNANNPEQKHLLDGIAYAIGGNSAQVFMPYLASNQVDVDVIAHIDIQAEHAGSGWNFLINWPGFIIFAPSWHGYMYEVKYTINCTLSKGGSNETIDTFTLPIALDIRHASHNRTWTEISWMEFSVIAFVGGLVFISYDDHVTPLVSEKIESPLGKYIAKEIVSRIRFLGDASSAKTNE